LNVSGEIFKLLAELDDIWKEASLSPDLFCIELNCGVYGLKDGPLLWFIKFVSCLTENGLKQSSHDSCVFYLPLSEKDIVEQTVEITDTGVAIGLTLSLHVDDTLATGTDRNLAWLSDFLTTEFEDVTCEQNHFRHFGVDVFRCPKLFHVYACQRDYVAGLNFIDMPARSKKETVCDEELTTKFRSLVSGVAWVGVTFAPALAAASLFQSYLPHPTHEHCKMLNGLLQQLIEEYCPLIFKAGLVGPYRLVAVNDSSLGNTSKYSQGGFYVMLATKTDSYLCGDSHQLAFKSSKSKRVASSTAHAETLALMAGTEESLFLQTWLYEISHPHVTSLQMINLPGGQLTPIIAITDSLDVLESMIKTAVPTPVNRALTLYLHALRELHQLQFIEAYVWVDTRDNFSNALTKLQPDGQLDLTGLKEVYTRSGWEPRYPYRWHSARLSDPEPYSPIEIPPPPAPTKVMADLKKGSAQADMLPTLQYRFVYVTLEAVVPFDYLG
jgi:hypothetical protein